MVFIHHEFFIFSYHLHTYYRICLVVFLDDQRSFPVGNALGLCGHVGKNAFIVWCYICFLVIGYYPDQDIRSFSWKLQLYAYTWHIP